MKGVTWTEDLRDRRGSQPRPRPHWRVEELWSLDQRLNQERTR